MTPLRLLGGALAGILSALPLAAPADAQTAPHPRICPNAQLTSDAGGEQQDLFCWIIQSSDGWLFHQGQFYGSIPIYPRTLPYLLRLNGVLKKMGTTLVLAPIPSKGMVFGEEALESNPEQEYAFAAQAAVNSRADYLRSVCDLNSLGVVTVDLLTPALHQKRDVVTGEAFYMKTDGHWAPYGARVSAAAIAELVKTLPGFDQVPKVTFRTRVSRTTELLGRQGEDLQRICGADWPPETIDVYVTEQTGAVMDSAALFGDVGNPIVLVGTSYSNLTYNFRGFLAEALGAKVLTVSLPGGAYLLSLNTFLISHGFQSSKPRFLIWELPVKYAGAEDDEVTHPGIGTEEFFGQVIASAYGDCGGAGVGEVKISLVPQKRSYDLKMDPSWLRPDRYLFVQTEDLSLTDFDLSATPGKRGAITWKARRPARIKNDGRFFFPIDSVVGRPATLRLKLNSDATGEFRVRVCRVPF